MEENSPILMHFFLFKAIEYDYWQDRELISNQTLKPDKTLFYAFARYTLVQVYKIKYIF